AERRLDHAGRLDQGHRLAHRPAPGELEVSVVVPERQPAWQVAVETGEPRGHRVEARMDHPAAQVHEGQEELAAAVGSPSDRTPPGVPEGLLPGPTADAVAVGIER